MADRRANPRADLLTAIANSKMGNELLPQEYLDGSWLLIIFAGNDTTRNSLSGTMRLLTQFPDQKKIVQEDVSLIPKMLQESLRMTSPVMHMRRTTLQETELRGQRIGKDEKVILWYGAANRDPEVFPDPDKFDILAAGSPIYSYALPMKKSWTASPICIGQVSKPSPQIISFTPFRA